MSTKIELLIESLAGPAEDLETTLYDLLTLRGVETAIGAQLDVLGAIVGQAREGLSDDDFRRYIRARIAANKSEGTVPDLLLVVRQVLGDAEADPVVHQQYPAAVVVRVLDRAIPTATAEIMAKFLRAAAAAGVRVILESTSEEPSTLFRWDTGPGWDSGVLADAMDGE